MPTVTKMTRLGEVTIRPAKFDDFPAIAYLLVQLYAAELPGAFIGDLAGQQSLMRFTLEAQPTQSLKNRYVLCDARDQVLATGMIQYPTEPPFDRAPAGTIRMATKLLGYRATERLFLTVARSRIGVYARQESDTALLHSVVVDAQQRRQGLGRTLMDTLEKIIAEQGYPWAVLQVMSDNEAARRLYVHCGYQEIWRSPCWVTMLSWSSCVMRKALN
jgi:ribosomal protein S18 acetylase RimI-like enzyme